MPIIGLGIHFAIALFFAVHAVRTGREMYWLFVLFSFPLLGSLVYFAAVFLPHSRIERGLVQAGRKLEQTINPGRQLREAQDAFDLTPTAHNQMVLARALLDAGKVQEAVTQYDACLRGPFAKDPEIALDAAIAKLANKQAAEVIALLQDLRARAPAFRPEQAGILLAKAYVQAHRDAEAAAEFESVVERFDSVEARGEYALWALQTGQAAVAQRELAALDHRRKHMDKYTRSLYQELFRAIDAARKEGMK
ncbi:MAG: hypothetical protein ACLGI6_08235 [Gammaproteobacteria bacterium]